jgi:hypothetical protein
VTSKKKSEIAPVVEDFLATHFKDLMDRPSNFVRDCGRFNVSENAITHVTLSTVPMVDAVISKAKENGKDKL